MKYIKTFTHNETTNENAALINGIANIFCSVYVYLCTGECAAMFLSFNYKCSQAHRGNYCQACLVEHNDFFGPADLLCMCAELLFSVCGLFFYMKFLFIDFSLALVLVFDIRDRPFATTNPHG